MQTLEVFYPSESVELLPVPRSRLRSLRQNFVKLHSFWIEHVFSLGDVVMDDACWALMGEIAGMLPQAKNAAVLGFDLEALQTDLTQLEALFFAGNKDITPEELHGWNLTRFNIDAFQACGILALHHFNHKRILEEAELLRTEREKLRSQAEAAEKKPAKTKTTA